MKFTASKETGRNQRTPIRSSKPDVPNVEVEPGWFRINRKALIAAAVLLAVALIFPVFMLYEANAVYQNYVLQNRPNSNDATAWITLFQQAQAQANPYLIVLLVLEIVLIILFSISLWYAIRPPHERHSAHMHPDHP